MITEKIFNENLNSLREKISVSCTRAGRKIEEVCILPVTKNWPVEAVCFAHRAGFTRVGENRVQEAVSKQDELNNIRVNWDLIGHLQNNKAKLAVNRFNRIQTVDSEKLLKKLDASLRILNSQISILIQVNTGKDPAKFGVSEEKCQELLEKALTFETIKVDGFMTIAPFSPDNKSIPRIAFSRLRELRDQMESMYKISLKELSMGMSGDLDEAINEGSTMIRVGSALFGNRSY